MVTMNWYITYQSNRAETIMERALTLWNGDKTSSGYASSSGAQVLLNTMLLRCSNVVFNRAGAGIVLGSGTTPATINDHKMENYITEGLDVMLSKLIDADKTRVYKMTITNISKEPITIGEVGILGNVYTSSGSSANYALMERTVLDSPITIPAGGVGLLEYVITLQIPAV